LHTECKKELSELAGMEDRITAALMEKFSSPDVELVKPLAGLCLPACPSQQPPLDPHQLSFAERRQMFSTVVATTLETEEQHCNSNIGISAYRCEGDNTDIGLIDIDDTTGFTYGLEETIASDTCLHVDSVSSHFNCVCSHFNCDVHEMLYSNQFKMKRYSFKNSNACTLKRREHLITEMMNDECMNPNDEEAAMLRWLKPNARFPIALDSYERNSNACLASWHNHEDKLPDSEFNARDHSDGFSFLLNALSQNGVGPYSD
jgi:hypothetical protein